MVALTYILPKDLHYFVSLYTFLLLFVVCGFHLFISLLSRKYELHFRP